MSSYSPQSRKTQWLKLNLARLEAAARRNGNAHLARAARRDFAASRIADHVANYLGDAGCAPLTVEQYAELTLLLRSYTEPAVTPVA